MSTGVEQLCKELALPTDANPSKPDSIGTAIGDIRKLIEQGGQKQQQFEAIQTSVASLVQQVNTDLQQRAEANARQNQGVTSAGLHNSPLIRTFQSLKHWSAFWRSSAKTRRFFFMGWPLVSQRLV